ncbi:MULTISPECIES: very short patch repair endonuclease [Alphaproteobacteria]|uniref:very short patch repair endonuclease n=1 Tax=Alphaproteobacteria TaxID=28211 RepID=UPI0032636367
MADIVDKATRSRMMSGIKGKDTKPEMIVRRALHKAGFRYRLHVKDLPGKPDIVLPKYKTVIFVHGCFWHKHDCKYFKWPKTRPDFWKEKIEANVRRDRASSKQLENTGWNVLTIWECELRKENHLDTLGKLIPKIGCHDAI